MEKLLYFILSLSLIGNAWAYDPDLNCSDRINTGGLTLQTESCFAKGAQKDAPTNIADYCDCVQEKIEKNIIPKISAEELQNYQSAIQLRLKQNIEEETQATIVGVADKYTQLRLGKIMYPNKFDRENRCNIKESIELACDETAVKELDKYVDRGTFKQALYRGPRTKIMDATKKIKTLFNTSDARYAFDQFDDKSLDIIVKISRGHKISDSDLSFFKNYIMEYHPVFSGFNFVVNGASYYSPLHSDNSQLFFFNDYMKEALGVVMDEKWFDTTAKRSIKEYLDRKESKNRAKAECNNIQQDIVELCIKAKTPTSFQEKTDMRFLKAWAGPANFGWLSHEQVMDPDQYSAARDNIEGRLMCLLSNCETDSLLKDKDARRSYSKIMSTDTFFQFDSLGPTLCRFAGNISSDVAENIEPAGMTVNQLQGMSRKERVKRMLNNISIAIGDEVSNDFEEANPFENESIATAPNQGPEEEGFGAAVKSSLSEAAGQLSNAFTDNQDLGSPTISNPITNTIIGKSTDPSEKESSAPEEVTSQSAQQAPTVSPEAKKYEMLLKQLEDQIEANMKGTTGEDPDEVKSDNKELIAKANDLKKKLKELKREQRPQATTSASEKPQTQARPSLFSNTTGGRGVPSSPSSDSAMTRSATAPSAQSNSGQMSGANSMNATPMRDSSIKGSFSTYLDSVGVKNAVYVSKEQLNFSDKQQLNQIFKESNGAPIYTTEISATGEEIVVIYEPVVDKNGNLIEYKIKKTDKDDAAKQEMKKDSTVKKKKEDKRRKRTKVQDLNKLIDSAQ